MLINNLCQSVHRTIVSLSIIIIMYISYLVIVCVLSQNIIIIIISITNIIIINFYAQILKVRAVSRTTEGEWNDGIPLGMQR